MSSDGCKAWNIEHLVASVSNITALAGRPKARQGGIKLSIPRLQLLFLDCCRGSGAGPGPVLLPAKSQQGGQPGPRQLQPPARPSKQDVFIGNRLSANISNTLQPRLFHRPWLRLLHSKLGLSLPSGDTRNYCNSTR